MEGERVGMVIGNGKPLMFYFKVVSCETKLLEIDASFV